MHKSFRSILVFLFDLGAVGVAWIGGFLIRFNFEWPAGYNDKIVLGLGVLLLVHAAACRWAGLYRGMWIFASLPDPRSEGFGLPSALNALRNSLTRAWMHPAFWIN